MAESIAEMLKRLRLEKGWSQRRLADEAGVHHSLISKIERGKETPSPAVTGRLAGALGADVAQLELAAGRVPDEFRKVILQCKEAQLLLRHAAEGSLDPEVWEKLRELLDSTGRGPVNVPVWLDR